MFLLLIYNFHSLVIDITEHVNSRFFIIETGLMDASVILLVIIIAAIAAITGICVYIKCKAHHAMSHDIPSCGKVTNIPIIDETAEEIIEETPAKEGFIASGTNGAVFNPRSNSIEGAHLYSNQMIQNGKSWGDVVDAAQKENVATDGPGSIGAGKGNGYDSAFKAQCKLAEAWENVRNGFMTNEEFNSLSQEINSSTAPQSDTSMFNRGNQTCGKMTILPNKLVCVIDEKYMDERSKNRDIFKTNTIVHCQGYDIDTNNVGRALSDSHFSKYLMNNNGHRKITNAGASTGGLNVAKNDNEPKNAAAETFKAKFRKEGFAKSSSKGYRTVKNSCDGGVWYQRK